MQIQPWLVYAFLAAICAAAINIFGKVGMRHINSDFATSVRSVVQAAFVVSFALVEGLWNQFGTLKPLSISMIVLSGVAGGLSWIFGFRALQLAEVSQVAPIDKLSMPLGIILAVILLKDRPSLVNWAGIALIVAGAFLATRPRAAAAAGIGQEKPVSTATTGR